MMLTRDIKDAIARHEAWLNGQTNGIPAEIEVENVRINELWVTADVVIHAGPDRTERYKGSVYPYWLLKEYMGRKEGPSK